MAKSNDTMRIGIDLRYLQAAYRNSKDGGLGGVGVYSKGLWKALTKSFPEVEWVGLIDHGDVPEKLFELLSLAPKFSILPFGLAGRGRFFKRIDRSSYSWIIRALESEFGFGVPQKTVPFDILHILNQAPPPIGEYPTVVTMYDFCPLGAGIPVKQTLPEKIYRHYLARLGRADHLVCISEATQYDAKHYLPDCQEKTSVIHPGIDLKVFKPGITNKTEVKEKFGIVTDFFIHVGVCSGRKNPRGLIEAMSIAGNVCKENFVLAFAGPYQVNNAASQTILELAKDYGIEERIMILGDVSDADLAMLYRNALALVFPSFYEGFGYPAVESLACGTSCIVSNISSLPETVGDLGVLVDPKDPAQIAHAMISIICSGKDGHIQTEGPRWAQKFSWDCAASAYMDIYKSLMHDGR
jgi:glycosyltransferase involved in cell wall biosynthesis